MFKFKNIILSLALGLSVISCASSDKKTIVIGTEGKYPPFEYLLDGELVGFDIDLFTAIAEVADIDFEFNEMAFDGLIPALQAKKIDGIIAGMTVTDDRKKIVSFSDSYFFTDGQSIGTLDGVADSLDGLGDKTVGVVIGYIADTMMTDKGHSDLLRFNNASEMVIALQAKKIDAFVLDSIPAKHFQASNSFIKLTDAKETAEEYAMAFLPENADLVKKVNAGLKIVMENGTYDELYAKYFSEE